MMQTPNNELVDQSQSFGDGDDSASIHLTKTNENEAQKKRGAKDNALAFIETQAVNRSKRLVYLVLLGAACAVGVATFFYASKEEKDDFNSKFDGYAQALVEGAERNAKDIFGELLSLSQAFTSFTLHNSNSNAHWPNVTLPDFDIRTIPAFESISSPDLFFFAPIVQADEKKAWEEYAWKHQDWIQQDLMHQRGLSNHRQQEDIKLNTGTIPRRIHPFFPDDEYDLNEIEQFVPLWQMPLHALGNTSVLLLDLNSHPSFRRMMDAAVSVRHMLFSEVLDPSFLMVHDALAEHKLHDALAEHNSNLDNPRSFGLQPVYESFEKDAAIVGFVFAIIPWHIFFSNVLQSDASKLLVEVTDTCQSAFSYEVQGRKATFLGQSLLHDEKFDNLSRAQEFAVFSRYDGYTLGYMTHCSYTINIFPTVDFQNTYETSSPTFFALALVLVFLFTMLVFMAYDGMVQRRQTKVMATANRTSQLVSSLFPEAVQERILGAAAEEEEAEQTVRRNKKRRFGAKNKMKDFLEENGEESRDETSSGSVMKQKGAPIADLFPSASVLFADLVGFTAWSSVREPTQVFQLLETLYKNFDEIAKRRRVYKVETIGDCWVGACGLPEVRPDHAVCISRFSRDMLHTMKDLVRELELDLGPDTGELGMRIGIHSGPVTAGVLRGDRARFQLFGDTVNTAARMESNGAKNRIHISKETADLLTKAGKDHWFIAREDKIVAKGKGELQTYWLNVINRYASSNESTYTGSDVSFTCADGIDFDEGEDVTPQAEHMLSEKYQRLVSWIADVLTHLLKEIQSKREANSVKEESASELRALEQSTLSHESVVMDELVDIIRLPDCNGSIRKKEQGEINLSPRANEQLHDYLTVLASLYRDNAFHNLEHASHVTMSVIKLWTRIVKPNLDEINEKKLHDHTYGLTSDPLVQFSVIFSALIHDADHPGVPNAVLVKENDPLSIKYKGQSIAEQRSVDCAWELLQKDEYIDLRRAIYATEDEFRRFRQLVVNTTLATDIADKELGLARKNRWNLAFAHDSEKGVEKDATRDRNRKATIVIEHLIQASDVAHTMQHWHVYRKWNERFFMECYKAYKDGRADIDPSINWYQGEVGFFDFYIIPLAKKLSDCGCFGVSSEEYLNYAVSNRNEWELKGQEIVASMVEKVTTPASDN